MQNNNSLYKKSILAFVGAILTFIPSTFAAASSFNPVQSVGNLGEFLWRLMQNDGAVYFFTVVAIFTLLFAIYMAAIKRVKVFTEGNKISTYGKVTAGAFAALSTASIFAYTESQGGMRQVATALLESFGVMGGIVFGFVTFAICYFGFGDGDGSDRWKKSMAGVGIALVGYGALANQKNITFWGWVILLIGLLIWFFTSLGKGTGDGSGGNNSGGGTGGGTGSGNETLGPINFHDCRHDGTTLHLEWDAVPNVQRYQIEVTPIRSWINPRRYSPGMRGHNHYSTTATTSTIPNCEANTSYYVWVRAATNDARYKSGPWGKIRIEPNNLPLQAPHLEPIEIDSGSNYVLRWNTIPNATHYQIGYQRYTAGGWTPAHPGAPDMLSPPTNATTYSIPIRHSHIGHLYEFTITPLRADGTPGPISNAETVSVMPGSRRSAIERDPVTGAVRHVMITIPMRASPRKII